MRAEPIAERRDVVVVGASAGGVESLSQLVARLPADVPACLLVVLHVAARGTSVLPEILTRAGALTASHPQPGDVLRHGHVYVAPPDLHMTIDAEQRIVLGRGPRENGYRPAVDVLFRSAAEHAAERTLGIVLTGALDDGSAGLAELKRAGALTAVQDPEQALYPSMPQSALAAARPRHVLSLEHLAQLIVRAAHEPFPTEEETMEVPEEKSPGALERGDNNPGVMTGFTCPECSGTLWEDSSETAVVFRCRVGHAYATASLVNAQADALEAGLWAAIRALHEKATLSRRVAIRLERAGQVGSAGRFAQQATEAHRLAGELQSVLEQLEHEPADAALAEMG